MLTAGEAGGELAGRRLAGCESCLLPDAETALDEIADQGGSAPEVYRWLSETDTWQGHARDEPFHNFPLELGQGYFFRATAGSTVGTGSGGGAAGVHSGAGRSARPG